MTFNIFVSGMFCFNRFAATSGSINVVLINLQSMNLQFLNTIVPFKYAIPIVGDIENTSQQSKKTLSLISPSNIAAADGPIKMHLLNVLFSWC
ncbi:TPA: hypothetical protein L9G66_002342 [Klebsiella pneumoniae]|nr:hypothetical protein [Klebsiella pneumoniae]